MRLNFNNGAMPDVASRTATVMDRSREKKDTRGCGWFSLFFWPAFRRIFFLDSKLEVRHRRTNAGPSPEAAGAKKRHDAASASTVPQIVIDTQMEHWIRWTLESNIALAAALKRLRDSYKLVQAGKPVEDSEKILAEVDAALKTVEERSM
jgi:hypothetical protein